MADVEVVLPGGGSPSVTDESGQYVFSAVAVGLHTVSIAATEFQPGGTLHTWAASPQNAAPEDVDSDADQSTHEAVVRVAAGQVSTSDFGFDIASSYQIDAQVDRPVAMPGETVQLTVRITNTGSAPIVSLPLQQIYDQTYLTFGQGGATAEPAPDDNENDGFLVWTDLTDSFGQDLGPGASFTVTVRFIAAKDTSQLPQGQTDTMSVVAGATVDPDAGGPLQGLETLPEQQDVNGLQIINPTGVELAAFAGEAKTGGVTLRWETSDETQIVGFNVWRSEAGREAVLVSAELMFARYSGAVQGSAYAVTDGSVSSGGTYEYVLEVVRVDGRVERLGATAVSVGWWTALPLVM